MKNKRIEKLQIKKYVNKIKTSHPQDLKIFYTNINVLISTFYICLELLVFYYLIKLSFNCIWE